MAAHPGRIAPEGGLASIFSNPKLPTIEDYHEPWTYDYETLLNSPQQKNFPVAAPSR